MLYARQPGQGATLAEGLQKAIEAALAALPIPKVMSYQLQDGWTSVNFVRPAHRLVALHGAAVVPVASSAWRRARNRGHRFEAVVDPVVLADADSFTPRRCGVTVRSSPASPNAGPRSPASLKAAAARPVRPGDRG